MKKLFTFKNLLILIIVIIGLLLVFGNKLNVFEGYNNAATDYADFVRNGGGTTKNITTTTNNVGVNGSSNINAYGSNGIAKNGYDASGAAILSFDSSGKPIIGYDKDNKPIFGTIAKAPPPGPKLPSTSGNIVGFNSDGTPIFEEDYLQTSSPSPSPGQIYNPSPSPSPATGQFTSGANGVTGGPLTVVKTFNF
jgi:hypothetical protein